MSQPVDVDAVAERLLGDRRLRRALLLAVARESATRGDVELLRRDVAGVREELVRLGERIHSVEERVEALRGEVKTLATKEELEELRREVEKLATREELRAEVAKLATKEELRREVSRLEERLARVEAKLDLLAKLFMAFNLPILLGIIGLLLKMVLQQPAQPQPP